MKIKDCTKGFMRGIGKTIPPEQTCKIVLRKIRNIRPPILKEYFEILRPSNIPQYRVIGSEHYQQVVQREGTNGKGHFKRQALASGIMELVERYSCFKYLRNKDYLKMPPLECPRNNLFKLEDLYSNLTNKDSIEMLRKLLKLDEICWYKGYSLDGKKVHLPMDIITQVVEVSNGMAAGNSIEEALLHGICEVVERHCLDLIDNGKLKTPLIATSTIHSPIVRKLIKKYQLLKQQFFIKDFSLGIGLPVIGVVRKINKNNCIITAGVATTREEALIRALIENSQIEDRRQYKKVLISKNYFLKDKVISMEDILDIDDKNIKMELEKIAEILDKQGMKIFYVDTTDRILNIPSVIVYITGAKYFDEDITYRIGHRYIQTNRPYKAVEVYEKALNIWPDNGAIWLGLAILYFSLRRYDKAIKSANKAIRLNFINGGDPHFVLGLCFEKIFQYKKAIEELKKAAKINPTEPQIFFALSNSYRSIGQVERADEELNRGIAFVVRSSSRNKDW